MNKRQILVDSDALVGWLMPDDMLHEEYVHIWESIKKGKKVITVTSLVVNEAATVLSKRSGQNTAIDFLDLVEDLVVIHMTDELQAQALHLFREQGTKGISVVDCANVVVAQRFGIPTIFSFDRFYRNYLEILR